MITWLACVLLPTELPGLTSTALCLFGFGTVLRFWACLVRSAAVAAVLAAAAAAAAGALAVSSFSCRCRPLLLQGSSNRKIFLRRRQC